jgi:hypothetical protein
MDLSGTAALGAFKGTSSTASGITDIGAGQVLTCSFDCPGGVSVLDVEFTIRLYKLV